MPVRLHPGETLPKGLNRGEVLRLLATSEGNRQADLRARAILMVLIAYGLRASEVAGLRLDDLDWEEETLRVRRPKSGCTHHYALSRGVGQAICKSDDAAAGKRSSTSTSRAENTDSVRCGPDRSRAH